MSNTQVCTKRVFDIVLSLVALVLLLPIIFFCIMLVRISTGEPGLFKQKRIGRRAREFTIYKIRTMRTDSRFLSTVTVENDPRITTIGSFLRKTKVDEFPQLWNVLIGEMSFVGPRPDVRGFADKLEGSDLKILELRPGITGPATIKYRGEENILGSVENPDIFSSQVLYPDKVKLNLDYISNWSLMTDIKLILITLKLLRCPRHLSISPEDLDDLTPA